MPKNKHFKKILLEHYFILIVHLLKNMNYVICICFTEHMLSFTIYKHHDFPLLKNIKLEYCNTDKSVLLNNHSLKQLDIINNSTNKKFSSLSKLLNECELIR